mmetsp:Transcript_19668/g.74393  ORF Transcript_19668/g.74393 Transcript_19668/m.74393 type:complete len:330 (+) Transcript_19668:2539-3528(+)
MPCRADEQIVAVCTCLLVRLLEQAFVDVSPLRLCAHRRLCCCCDLSCEANSSSGGRSVWCGPLAAWLLRLACTRIVLPFLPCSCRGKLGIHVRWTFLSAGLLPAEILFLALSLFALLCRFALGLVLRFDLPPSGHPLPELCQLLIVRSQTNHVVFRERPIFVLQSANTNLLHGLLGKHPARRAEDAEGRLACEFNSCNRAHRFVLLLREPAERQVFQAANVREGLRKRALQQAVNDHVLLVQIAQLASHDGIVQSLVADGAVAHAVLHQLGFRLGVLPRLSRVLAMSHELALYRDHATVGSHVHCAPLGKSGGHVNPRANVEVSRSPAP